MELRYRAPGAAGPDDPRHGAPAAARGRAASSWTTRSAARRASSSPRAETEQVVLNAAGRAPPDACRRACASLCASILEFQDSLDDPAPMKAKATAGLRPTARSALLPRPLRRCCSSSSTSSSPRVPSTTPSSCPFTAGVARVSAVVLNVLGEKVTVDGHGDPLRPRSRSTSRTAATASRRRCSSARPSSPSPRPGGGGSSGSSSGFAAIQLHQPRARRLPLLDRRAPPAALLLLAHGPLAVGRRALRRAPLPPLGVARAADAGRRGRRSAWRRPKAAEPPAGDSAPARRPRRGCAWPRGSRSGSLSGSPSRRPTSARSPPRRSVLLRTFESPAVTSPRGAERRDPRRPLRLSAGLAAAGPAGGGPPLQLRAARGALRARRRARCEPARFGRFWLAAASPLGRPRRSRSSSRSSRSTPRGWGPGARRTTGPSRATSGREGSTSTRSPGRFAAPFALWWALGRPAAGGRPRRARPRSPSERALAPRRRRVPGAGTGSPGSRTPSASRSATRARC